MYEDPELIDSTSEQYLFNDAVSVIGPPSVVDEQIAVFDGTTSYSIPS